MEPVIVSTPMPAMAYWAVAIGIVIGAVVGFILGWIVCGNRAPAQPPAR